MATSQDPNWPSAASLLSANAKPGLRQVALSGIHTYATSVSARSATSTPQAVRSALERYSTWSYSDGVDLAEVVSIQDLGDVENPDGPGGNKRVEALLANARHPELHLILGGDNAATWLALSALAGNALDSVGLITLDAHLDMRDGRSNGSPVRQLLEAGLAAQNVVQVGLADFSNSAPYARAAHQAGSHAITRDELRRLSVEEAAVRAVTLASRGGKKVYVDIDVDAADRSVVPGCPAASPGGLSADEMRRFVRAVVACDEVFAIDFTEVDVERDDRDERTVRLVALLVLEALSGLQRRNK